jgi:hypothetical protein
VILALAWIAKAESFPEEIARLDCSIGLYEISTIKLPTIVNNQPARLILTAQGGGEALASTQPWVCDQHKRCPSSRDGSHWLFGRLERSRQDRWIFDGMPVPRVPPKRCLGCTLR